MMKLFSLLMVLGLTMVLAMAGCTSYVRPSDIQANFTGMLQGADRAQNDYNAKLQLYQKAISLSGQPQLNPYPDMKDLLGQMQPLIKQMRDQAKQLQNYKSNFDQLFAGRDQISSKDPDWDKYQTLNVQFNAQRQPLNDLWNQYNQSAVAFQQDVDHFMIGPISLDEANRRLNGSMNHLQNSIDKYAPQMDKIAGAVLTFKAQNLSYDFVENKIQTMQAVKDTVGDLYALRHDLKPQADDLANYLAQQQPREVWVGPGIPHTGVLVKLRDADRQIHGDEKRLDDLLAQFNPPATPQPAPATTPTH